MKETGRFRASIEGINEKMSLKMGVKFAALVYIWARIFYMCCMYLSAKELEMN